MRPAYGWGDDNQQNIVDLIVQLIQNDKAQYLGQKNHVYWGDIETIHEAVNEACICLGLDEDNFSPYLHVDGFEFEITLYA